MAVGLFVDAAIQGRQIANAVVVPREALRNGEHVFVVSEDDTLDIRQAQLIHSSPDSAILAGGVAEGERVVVSPIQTPTDGLRLDPLSVEGEGVDVQEEDEAQDDVSIARANDGEPT